jgi:hypothetical protein
MFTDHTIIVEFTAPATTYKGFSALPIRCKTGAIGLDI